MKPKWYNPLSWRFFGYTDNQGHTVEITELGSETASGVRINPKTALTLPIVWSCVKVLSESAAGLPLKLYEDNGPKRTVVKSTDRAARLLGKPNPYMTRLSLIKASVVNMALRGNAFALIERNTQGEWIGLVPLAYDSVELDETEDLLYWVTTGSQRFPVSPSNMLHFKLFSSDGLWGLSPVEYMRESMGLAQAAQKWAARFMRKGGFTGGYVVYEQFLTKEQRDGVLSRFPKIRNGDVEDLGMMGLVEGGPKIVPAGLSQKDAQFIETQQFQEEALAGIWGVPLYLANRASKTSIMGSNLEQQVASFITFGLKPYLDAIEDELNDKLFTGTQRFVEFVVEGLLRADSAARATYYQAALGGSAGSGWMTTNEVRAKENLPALEGEQYSQVTRWDNTNAQQT